MWEVQKNNSFSMFHHFVRYVLKMSFSATATLADQTATFPVPKATLPVPQKNTIFAPSQNVVATFCSPCLGPTHTKWEAAARF